MINPIQKSKERKKFLTSIQIYQNKYIKTNKTKSTIHNELSKVVIIQSNMRIELFYCLIYVIVAYSKMKKKNEWRVEDNVVIKSIFKFVED